MTLPIRRRPWSTIAWLALAALGPGQAQALQEGTWDASHRFASGGVSDEELGALYAQRRAFNLWIVTAARTTGAFLTDVQLRIVDAQQNVVFEGTLAGPWLLIDLPLGRYVVEARLNGQTQQHVTTLHQGDRHQAFFYFDADADILPERPAPLRANPYAD